MENTVKIAFTHRDFGNICLWKKHCTEVSKPDFQSRPYHLLLGRYQKSHVTSVCSSCFTSKRRS